MKSTVLPIFVLTVLASLAGTAATCWWLSTAETEPLQPALTQPVSTSLWTLVIINIPFILLGQLALLSYRSCLSIYRELHQMGQADQENRTV